MKVAILGAAHQHVDYALTEVALREELELVGASEPDPDLRDRFLGELEVPLYETAEDLLASHDVDVALVAGVYSERAAAAVAAMDAGAHVLADKPLCTSLEQLAQIREAAARSQRHVSIVFEKRFYGPTLALRRLLADEELGEIALIASTGPHKLNRPARPDWFLDPTTYGGIAGDLPIHDIDLVLDLAGAARGTVSARTGRALTDPAVGIEDHVALLLHTGSVSATIEANWLAPQASEVHGHYRMRVTGTRGTAELDWAFQHLTVTTHDRATWEPPLPGAPRPAQYFFDALSADREPEITTAASLLATEVALKAQASAEAGGEVRDF